jgi:uncharacterized repeat protein (TIGR01451 family)
MIGTCFAPPPAPDLKLTVTDSPDPVSVGELLTLSFSITNQGSHSASSVELVATLSSNTTYFSGSASQGGVVHSNGVVTCAVGSVAVGGAATLNLVITPGAIGSVTNIAVLSENETDQNPADNLTSVATLVTPLTFYPGANMVQARYQHTATLLLNGKVLIAGGYGNTGALATAELYDPALKSFSPTPGQLPRPMIGHSATLLQDGTVLLAGGGYNAKDAFLYNPTNGTFGSLGSMIDYHSGHSATRLDDGRVLITGGPGDIAQAELYEPASQTFVVTGRRITGSQGHRAFLLTNGTVAMLGGAWINNLAPTNDLYNPSLGSFESLGTVNAQAGAGGTALLDGNILMTGGFVQSSLSTVATIFHPATSNFTATGASQYPHPRATATRLGDGKVLVVGSDHLYTVNEAAQATPELYDPVSGTFALTAPLATRRQDHTATLLPDGTVLIAGGRYFDFFIGPYGGYVDLASTEIYDHTRMRRPPTVSLGNVTVLEGDAGTTYALLPLTLSARVGLPVSVTLWGTSTVLTFPAGVTNIDYPVAIEGNRDFGPDQVLGFGIRNPVNAALGEDRGTVTVLNDDPPPAVSVIPTSVPEGNVGTNSITLTVLLSATSTEPISVDVHTLDGVAQEGSDYFATNSTLTFNPGVTNLSVEVRLRPDILIEPNETFYVTVTNTINAVVVTNQFPVTILNDDGLPGDIHHLQLSPVASPQHKQTPFPLTIIARDASDQVATNFNGGVTVWATLTNAPWLEFDFEEGDFSQWTPLNLGNTPGPYEMAQFDVAGHGASSLAFRVLPNNGAADGIARSITLQGGILYFLSVDVAAWNENSGFANFSPGTAHMQVNGQEIGTFSFDVFGIINALQTFRTNLITAYTAPSNGTYELSLRFDRPAGQANVWNYADNVRISPARLTPVWLAPFTNGVWSGAFQVKTNALGLRLLAVDGEGHRGEGNVFDVETMANLVIQATNSPAALRAGMLGTFTLSVSNRGPSTAAGVVISNVLVGDWTFGSASVTQGTLTTNGPATVANVGTMTNGRSVTLTVSARPHTIGALTNTAFVWSEVFDSDLTNNTVLTVVTAAPPLLRVDNLSFTEGNAGTNFAQVVVWQDGAVGQALSFDYATVNGTAQSGSDYLAAAGTLVIPSDVVTQFLSIPILGDLQDEPNRGFALQLSNPTNATLNSSTATVTIVDDDPVPAVSIADAAIAEGNSGTATMVFGVTLANPSSSTVQITCTTSNGTALSGSDYASTTSTLTFPAGTTNQNFNVVVFGDVNGEVDQTLVVKLSSPVNCGIDRGTAVGTILNDDLVPGGLLQFAFDQIPVLQYSNRPFALTIRAQDYLNQAVAFPGSVTLKAQTDGYYIKRLFDDFEDGDLSGWSNLSSGLLTASNVNDMATNGVRSLRLTGRSPGANFASSLRYTMTNSRPNKVSFYVRSAQTNAICGRIWAVGGAGYRAFEFYLNKDGRMGLFNNSTALATVPYTSNRWYRVEMDLTWGTLYSTRKINCSIDGVVLTNGLNFLDDTYSGLDWISVQNTETATSWFDDIHVYDSFFTNLTVTPSNLSGFANGVWTGNVKIAQPGTNVYLTVNDNSDHYGKSSLFHVLPLWPQNEPLAPSLGFGSPVFLNGQVNLVLYGIPGIYYRLQSSTNLTDWSGVTNFTSPSPLTPLHVPANSNDASRFYRAVIP